MHLHKSSVCVKSILNITVIIITNFICIASFKTKLQTALHWMN